MSLMMRTRTLSLVILVLAVALAGCIEPRPGPQPSLAYGPGFHTVPYRNLTLEGLEVPDPVATGAEQTWRLRVSHRADSGDDFVYSGVCLSPWAVRLSDAYGRDLHWTEIHPVCEAYAEAHLPPGETREWTFTWDGEHHPEGGPGSKRLEPGAYVLMFRFVGLTNGGEGPTAFHVFEIA